MPPLTFIDEDEDTEEGTDVVDEGNDTLPKELRDKLRLADELMDGSIGLISQLSYNLKHLRTLTECPVCRGDIDKSVEILDIISQMLKDLKKNFPEREALKQLSKSKEKKSILGRLF